MVVSVCEWIVTAGKCFGFSPISASSFLKILQPIYSLLIIVVYIIFVVLELMFEAPKTIDRKLQFFAASVQFIANSVFAWINLDDLVSFLYGISKLQLVLAAKPSALPFVLIIFMVTIKLVVIIIEFCLDGFLIELVVQFFAEILLSQILMFSFILYHFYCQLERFLQNLIRDGLRYQIANTGCLREFRRILLELNEAADNLNTYYSIPLVFFYFSASVNIILESYYLLSSSTIILRSIFKVISHFLNITALSFIFQLIVNKETSIIKLLLYTSVRKINFLSSEALVVFNQLESTTVSFSAANLFNINFSSLLSVFGVFLGYLIILLQTHPELH